MLRNAILTLILLTSPLANANGPTMLDQLQPGLDSLTRPTTCITFDQTQLVDRVSWPRSLMAGDFDGDGDIDLARTISEHRARPIALEWYENSNGDGSSWRNHPVKTGALYTHLLQVADVDHDGNDDLFALIDDQLVWMKRTTDKSWDAQPIPAPSVRPDRFPASTLLDIDRDRYSDIVVATTQGLLLGRNRLRWGGQPWLGQLVDTMAPTDDSRVQLASGDVDGDNRVDIVAAGRIPSQGFQVKIVWYRNQAADVTLPNVPIKFERTIIDGVRDIFDLEVGDMDGDGDMDVVASVWTTSSGPNRGLWFENLHGDGSEWERHTLTEGLDFYTELEDMNGDGLTDIVTYSFTPSYSGLVWIQNNAGGSADRWIRTPLRAASTTYGGGLVIADIDNNGTPDIVDAVNRRSGSTDRLMIYFGSRCDTSLGRRAWPVKKPRAAR